MAGKDRVFRHGRARRALKQCRERLGRVRQSA